MKIKYFVIIAIILVQGQKIDAQKLAYEHVSYIYDQNIGSVTLSSSPNTSKIPIFLLDQGFKLNFDDLSGVERNFFYKFIHCDRNWNPSGLRDVDFVDGFNDEPLRTFTYSVNTRIQYIHYSQSIPSKFSKLKISGNYILLIYEDTPETPIMTQQFIMCENSVGLNINQIFPSDVSNIKYKQEFTVDLTNTKLKIRFPKEEFTVTMYKNNDFNSARSSEPNFITNDKIRFNQLGSYLFWGGIEYRDFDTRSLNVLGRKVEKVVRSKDGFDVMLVPAQTLNKDRYTTLFDFNGGFYVDNFDALTSVPNGSTIEGKVLFSDSPERDINADYVFVQFKLGGNVDLLNDEDVYILGAFNNWQPSADYKMTWSDTDLMYKQTILLKQGFYNYSFGIVDSEGKIRYNTLDGSWAETENQYTAVAYFKGITDIYDRVVACTEYNTSQNVTRY